MKTVLSRISQNSEENIEVCFNKDAELQPTTFRQRCFPVTRCSNVFFADSGHGNARWNSLLP